MKIEDLGELSGDVMLFGGPYSNLQATGALIAAARGRGIAPGNCICTGDVVAYCANAGATTKMIRQFGCPVVAGNMEQQLGAGATDCGCGLEEGTACDLMSGYWFAHAAQDIDTADRAWMATCPDWIVFQHEGRRALVVHGAPSDVARFVWPVSPDSALLQEISIAERIVGKIDLLISGHSGVPFVRDLGECHWVNAGVIGMPPHDGGTCTRYAILSGQGISIEKLAYDAPGAAEAMRAAGLTQGYERALETGYWPSEDVLPPELRLASCESG